MNKTKKIILILLFIVSISSSVFAASGFEFILNVPLGVDIGMDVRNKIKNNEKYEALKPSAFLDAGATLQFGYMLQVANNVGLSLLAETGYSYTSFPYLDPNNSKAGITFVYDTVQVGVLPKINIGNTSIGIGAGVKLPLAGTQIEYNSTGTESKHKLSYEDIKNGSISSVIPYVKLTFDYSIFLADLHALNIGAYVGYNFGLSPKADEYFEYHYLDSISVGIQLGYRFGPKVSM